jgi:hypothetical protein
MHPFFDLDDDDEGIDSEVGQICFSPFGKTLFSSFYMIYVLHICIPRGKGLCFFPFGKTLCSSFSCSIEAADLVHLEVARGSLEVHTGTSSNL